MNPKYSISHLTLLKLSPPELIQVADKAGYDYVSLRTICMNLGNEPDYALATNPGLYNETKTALAQSNVKLLDIELAKIHDEIDFGHYEREMEVAAKLGAKHVISSIWTENRAFAVECYYKLCEIAISYNLTIELEAVPISSVKKTSDILGILKEVNHPNQGLLVDIHHFHRSQEPLSVLKTIPPEWIHFIHLCDASLEIPTSSEEMLKIIREKRLYIGEGGIDIYSIVEALPYVPMSIELPNLERSNKMGSLEFATACLNSAKDYFRDKTLKRLCN